MANWETLTLLNAQLELSGTVSAVTSLEISPDAEYLNVQVNQSGTASVVLIQASMDNSLWHNVISVATSTTYHAITAVPRYLRAYVDDVTHDSHVVVTMQYRKP